jgi:hypothetical protein
MDSVGYIHFAIIDKIMLSHKVLYGFFHDLDIQIVFRKEIFVRSIDTTIAGIEIVWDLFAADYSNIFWQQTVHHLAIVYCVWGG